MTLALRPTFTIQLPDPPEAVAHRLHQQLGGTDLETRWSRVPGASLEKARQQTFVLVTLAQAQRRFWSPWLHLDVRESNAGTELFGRYSPHPSVWTAFALGYLLLGAIVFLGSLFACAQTMLHSRSHAWWPVVFALMVAAGMWWSALVGQRLARDQMEELDARIQSALSSSS